MSLFMTRTYDKCTTPSQYMRYWREDVLGVSIDAYVGRVRVDTEGP